MQHPKQTNKQNYRKRGKRKWWMKVNKIIKENLPKWKDSSLQFGRATECIAQSIFSLIPHKKHKQTNKNTPNPTSSHILVKFQNLRRNRRFCRLQRGNHGSHAMKRGPAGFSFLHGNTRSKSKGHEAMGNIFNTPPHSARQLVKDEEWRYF